MSWSARATSSPAGTTSSRAGRSRGSRWSLRGGDFVVGQPAIATAVAIAKEDPAGLEAFTWAQQIPVMQRRTDGNPPPQFAEPETVSGQGDLAAGHSISSSLILKEGGAVAGDGRLVWQHELQIR
jgi:hypothetical protein